MNCVCVKLMYSVKGLVDSYRLTMESNNNVVVEI